ncbi:TTF-type domain-containing protein [Citrus sinensis]|uniref:uncharacterized protein LOC127899719 n=1 Tax=Citrus sinensis TaxID=2711 RepID=UPI002192D3D3|nr:uncharacterized protein LOC127899719 [Citrus sinensis]KAH9647563.1 TTF-type domain-containing protein [Citrus sinensis]
MSKPSKINQYFKRKNAEANTKSPNIENSQVSLTNSPNFGNPPLKAQRIETDPVITKLLERDPGLRPQIWVHDVNQRDEIRRAYIMAGPYQPRISEYPKSGPEKHRRRFQSSWFDSFPSWLEYSPIKDAAFCLPCYLFNTPSAHPKCKAYTVNGFNVWRKVKDGKNCAFLNHVEKDLNSSHKKAEKSCEDLMRQSQHLPQVFNCYSSHEIENNRLRLKTTVEAIRYLAFQGCSFRGHDESKNSLNRGNFLQLLKAFASNNEKITDVILDKAPKHASYISPNIQKEILHVFSMKVKKAIREEIGDAKFCLIVDESRDESKKEQMAVVLRFVDKDGFVRERFFGLVHVSNTSAVTLKDGIYSLLSHNNLSIQNIRGQGYDGASNMRGEWNGLQALILKDCPYAYYIHCLAHRLQLALVAVSHEIVPIHHFFTKLSSVVNIVGASCKRNEELKCAQATDIEYMISIDELESGRGLNQIGTLQRPGDTRWSSHFKSVSNLITMFNATCSVLLNIIEDGTNAFQRGDVDAAYEAMTSFEFVFILHLMKEIMAITDILCQALQSKSQDILHAKHLVSSTKALIQKFRDDGWITLLNQVKSFCEVRNIDIPEMNAQYVARQGRARRQEDNFTVAEHYRVNLFYVVIDCQLQELSSRFNEHSVQLLILSSALDPRECRESFRIGDVCQLADKFYLADFTDVDKMNLKIQLEHYEYNVVQHPEFKSLSTISDLSQWLVSTRKATIFPLVYRIIVLVLTLPVSTATTERSFSAMRIVKTRLHNKMEDEFLTDSLIMYIEREIAEKLSIESIVNEFRDMKERRIPF